jgi:hypothetical protein
MFLNAISHGECGVELIYKSMHWIEQGTLGHATYKQHM